METGTSWHTKEERGSDLALHILAYLFKICSRPVLDVLMYPVILYFFTTDKIARKSSYAFLQKIYPDDSVFQLYRKSFNHFYSFGRAILDTIDTWQNKFSVSDIDWHQNEIIINRLGRSVGGVVLSAHHGCLEICRSVQNERTHLKITPLMYLQNSLKFRNFLKAINPRYKFEYIPVEKMNAGFAVTIKERIENGEYIALLADRPAPNTPHRTIPVMFLGEEAQISEGPFALAWALKADVFTVFSAYNEKLKRYQVIWDKIEIERSHIRDKKSEEIKRLAESYMHILEREVRKNPLQWFNFYDFWSK